MEIIGQHVGVTSLPQCGYQGSVELGNKGLSPLNHLACVYCFSASKEPALCQIHIKGLMFPSIFKVQLAFSEKELKPNAPKITFSLDEGKNAKAFTNKNRLKLTCW